MIFRSLAAGLIIFAASGTAQAATAEDLRCLDSQLSLDQRAAVGSMFAEQAEPTIQAKQDDKAPDARTMANGSTSGAERLASVLGGCVSRFGWTAAQRTAAIQYLIDQGALSRVAVSQGERWATTMEAYAPFGSRLLPREGDASEHVRAMIAAGAKANGVPKGESDEAEESPIIEYLTRYRTVEATRTAFLAVR